MNNVIQIKICYAIFVTDDNGSVMAHSIYDMEAEANARLEELNAEAFCGDVYDIGKVTYTNEDFKGVPPLCEAVELECEEITDKDYPVILPWGSDY